MGTNYYHHSQACPCCGRSDPRVHIGKSSAGWTFSFHGGDLGAEGVRSWKDWQGRLSTATQNGGRIVDEYGAEITLAELVGVVEDRHDPRGPLQNHTVYCRTHHPEHAERDCWLDPEGHSFSRGEFS